MKKRSIYAFTLIGLVGCVSGLVFERPGQASDDVIQTYECFVSSSLRPLRNVGGSKRTLELIDDGTDSQGNLLLSASLDGYLFQARFIPGKEESSTVLSLLDAKGDLVAPAELNRTSASYQIGDREYVLECRMEFAPVIDPSPDNF